MMAAYEEFNQKRVELIYEGICGKPKMHGQ